MTYTAVGSDFGAAATGAVTSFSLTTVGAGNFALAEVYNDGATRVATGLSSTHATWAPLGTAGSTSAGKFQVFLGTVTSAATATVTITWGAGSAGTTEGVAGREFSTTTGIPVLDVQGTLNSAGTTTWVSLTPAAAGELYFGFALNAGSAVQGSTSGYTYNANVDTHSNGMAFNPACGASATAPVWGDSGQASGVMVLVKPGAAAAPAAAIPAVPYRPSKSRIQHHKGTRRQQLQAAFSSRAGPATLATSTSVKNLQRAAADKIAYLFDGSAVIGYWNGTAGQVAQVTAPLTAPAVTNLITTVDDGISLWAANTGTASDLWVASSSDDAASSGTAAVKLRHATYNGTTFTWDASTAVPGATSPNTIQCTVVWTGTYLIVFWWDGTSGTDRVSFAYTTDKTGTTGWVNAGTFSESGTWSTIVQVSARHSAKLAATVVAYEGNSGMHWAVLKDSAASPAVANWGGRAVLEQFTDSGNLFGGPQVVIDETSGDVHVAYPSSNNSGPTWFGVTYWHGTYATTGNGTVTWAGRLIVDSAGSATGPADIALAADVSGTVWVLWVSSTSQGNLRYATLASPYTSASAATTLVTGGASSNPRWPHVPAVSQAQAGLGTALPVLYTDTTASAYPIRLDTSIPLPVPASTAAPAGLATAAGTAQDTAFELAPAGLASAAGIAQLPQFGTYITAVSSDGTYFTDNHGSPRLFVGEDLWDLVINGGRWGGTVQTDIDAWCAARSAQGFTAVEVQMFSSTNSNSSYVFTDGRDWDGTWPFAGSGDPTTAANATFWNRRDYLFASAAAKGITVVMNLTTSWLAGPSWNASWSTAQWTAYGTFIGTRYKNTPNILWIVGDDYFGTVDTGLNAMLTALRAAGDTHPLSIQNYAETTSRTRLDTKAKDPVGFDIHAQYHWVYTYNVSYVGIVDACTITPSATDDVQGRLPALWGDGTYYGDGLPGGAVRNQLQREHTWWALSSGACGFSIGNNGIWQWTTNSLGFVTSDPQGNFMTAQVGAIAARFSGLPGWQGLRPDDTSLLVTGGRGTPTAPIVAGGGGTTYTSNADSYVTASRGPDTGSGASLAVIYMSHATTITIDQSKMVTGYTATWVDPANGATSSATPGTTYNSGTKGNNSDGTADWVLVLQAPAGVSATAGLASGAGTAQQPAGHNAQLVSGTGTAQDVADIAITANAGLASGTGTAQQPAGHNTGLATGTGTAPQAGGQNAQLASGTGTAQQPAGHNAGLATGTGTAQTVADIAITANAGLAAATGPALQAGGQNAQLASGTGTAPQAGGQNAQLATGTGSAPDAAVTTSGSANAPAGLATATGLALQAGGQNAGLAAAAGTAQDVADIAITANAGLAAATGPALQAGGHNAQLASGTGTAQAAQAAAAANAGLAAATGLALQAGGQNTQLASGTGTAQQPSVTTSGTANAPAGLASATGLALQAGGQNAQLATGTGPAPQPLAATTANAGLATAAGAAPASGMARAGLAAGTGTAPQAGGQNAQLAAGTGTAQQPVAAVTANAGLATATGLALQAGGQNAQLATGTGTAQQPAVTTSGTANAPAGLATAAGAVPASGMAQAGLAASTGTAPQAGGQNAQLAAGTGTAQDAGDIAVIANAILASGAGTAQQPAGHNTAPATGTGTAPQVTPAPGASAGLAAATGTVSQAQAGPQAALAAAAGTAQQPAGHITQLAASAGTAPQPLAVIAVNAPAQLAAGTGTARAPALILTTLAAAQAATALAAALQPAVQAAATVVKGHVAVTLADTAGVTGTVTRPQATAAGVTEAAGVQAGVS